MALPKSLQSTFQPSELSFIAENQVIDIIPRQALDSIDLYSGTIASMRPPRRSSVPLWLAILLKRQRRATLVPPSWLTVESLESKLHDESSSDSRGQHSGFSDLPFQWIELSDLILDAAPDDVPDVDIVRRLLRDIRETRQAKARDGLEVLEDKVLQMDNIGWTEINEIRGVFAGSMDVLRRLQETKPDEDGDDDDEAPEDADMQDQDESDG